MQEKESGMYIDNIIETSLSLERDITDKLRC